MSREKLAELAQTLEELARFKRENLLKTFVPYAKQKQFMDMGATKRERLLSAGNQNGKSHAGAFEAAVHLTGQYPAWWKGRRWDRPVNGWAAGVSSTLVRDIQQSKLCGKAGVVADWGTGFIPKDCLVDHSLARGATDAIDTLQVRHVSGGTSTLKFKSYEQGRAKFQADTLDFIWWDEEPPMEIYSEGLARITATAGMEFMTFTPMMGRSAVVIRLMEAHPDRGMVVMTIYDAEHISAEERKKIIDGYPASEREARAMGVPMMGEGRIFQMPEAMIVEAPLQYIPLHWHKLWAVDFGITHPFAAVLLLFDNDYDTIHVFHTIRMADSIPLQHVQALNRIAANVPVAWPHDGNSREKGSGQQLSKIYKSLGLQMLPQHATWPDGSMSTEAAARDMETRMLDGRLKVGAYLSDWLEEFRFYHRKDGLIVHERDDLLSATQKGIMMKRFAKAVPLGSERSKRRAQVIADGVDFDVLGT